MTGVGRIERTRGILICFIGIDGSGKSTLAHYARDLLLAQGIPTNLVWGGYELYFLGPMVRTVRKVVMKHSGGSQDYPRYQQSLERIGKARLLFTVYQYLLVLEYVVQVAIKIGAPLLLGRNVVSDRYVFDTAVSISANFGLSVDEQRHLTDWLLRVCPKPDLVFCVDVPATLAMTRKDDIPSIEYVSRRRECYRNMLGQYGIELIDGSNNLGQVKAQLEARLRRLWATTEQDRAAGA